MKDGLKQAAKKSLCTVLALCMTVSLISVSAFAEQTKGTTVEKVSTSTDFASVMGEYYEARTPANEKNALYVKGQVQQGVKMLRISLASLSNKSNYLNVFVQPDNNGSFEVKINTASGNKTAPTAVSGKVYSASDSAWDSCPGYKAVQSMPKGFYQLRIAVAKTAADADIANWHEGTLSGEHGFVWNLAVLYVSGSGNNPKLVEFSDIVSRSQTLQSTGSVYDSRYTDVYLKDISYVLKDSSFQNKPMNADRVAYIKKVANEITSGAKTDIERLAKIYKYVAGNFYYDHYAYELYANGTNIQCCNPYDNLYNLRNHIESTNSTSDGKVATVCDGYSAMIVALCRSLGMPSRMVYGCTNNIGDGSSGITSSVDTSKKNHWWAEVYIGGRWITVDAERGSLNSWNRDELSTSSLADDYYASKYKTAEHWDKQGWTTAGLDISPTLLASAFLTTGVQDSTNGRAYVESVTAGNDASSGNPKLTWTTVSGAEKYYIYRGTKESDIKYYASSKTNSFVDDSAQLGVRYYYTVRPVSTEEGANSNMVSAVRRTVAPTISITTSAGKPKLTWSAVSGATKYWIYRCTDGGSYKYYDTTTKTSYTNTSTTIGTTYYYKVKAVTVSGSANYESAYSNAKSIQRKPAAPTVTISRSVGKPKLTWSTVSGATKYWIYRSTDGESYKYYDTTTKTSYINSSTTIGTTYYYKVKAVAVVNGTNVSSAYSSVKKQLVASKAPTVKVTTSNGKPKLTWSSISGVTKYWIYRSTDGVNFSYYDTATRLSYTNTGAKAGTKYYYKVKAITVLNGKNIASGYSNTVSVKAK